MTKLIQFFVRYICALASCVYVFTVGIFQGKNRQFISNVALHFLYGRFKKRLVPSVSLASLCPQDQFIDLGHSVGVSGNVTLEELVVILNLVKKHNPAKVFEIGTFDGRSALNIAANTQESASVLTLDLPKEKIASAGLALAAADTEFINKNESGARFKGSPYEKKIIQLYGDSATFDFTPYINSVDFVFVDGSHSYEYVKNDTQAALKLLKDGKGAILWHDYSSGCDGVRRALNEFYLSGGLFKNIKNIEGTSLAYLFL